MKELVKKIGVGLEKAMEYTIYIALGGMVILVFINAVLRYAFNSGFAPGEELARYCFVWTIFLGIIAAYQDNKHVGVDLVTSQLKGLPKKIVELIGYVLIIIASGIMLVGGWSFAQLSMTSLGPATGIPFSVVVVPYVFASLYILIKNVVNVIRLLKGGE